MLGVYGIGFVTFLMYFVRGVLWRLCCFGVHGFGHLVVVICMVFRCVFALTVFMGRFGRYSGCGWVCNGCVGFMGRLEVWCYGWVVVWVVSGVDLYLNE